MTNQIHYSLEMISPQSKDFFNTLVLELRTFKESKEKDLSKLSETLHKVTKVFTQMNLTFLPGNSNYMRPPLLKETHVLFPNYGDGWVEDAVEELKQHANGKLAVKGSVDRTQGKVTGVFTQMQGWVIYDFTLVTSGKLTVEEFACVLLHEIGHHLTYFEFITNEMTTNQIIASTHRALQENQEPAIRETIITLVKDKEKLPIKDIKQLSTQSDDVVTATLDAYLRDPKRRSQRQSTASYDMVSYEALADQCVARWGGAVHLASALKKLISYDRSTWSSTTFLIANLVSLSAYLLLIAPRISLGSTALLSRVLKGKLLMGASMILKTIVGRAVVITIDPMGWADPRYDVAYVRLARIKEDLIAQLKLQMETKELREELLVEISVLETLLKSYQNHKPKYRRLWGMLGTKGTNERILAEQLDRELEELINNDLFKEAAALKSL